MRSDVVVIAVAVLVPFAAAQEPSVRTKSGTAVPGPIVSVDREGLLATDGARAVRIAFDDVASLRGDEPVAVALASGDRLTIRITAISGGQLEATHEALGALRIPIAALVAPEAAPPPGPSAPAPPGKEPPCCPATPLEPKPLKGKVALSATGRSGNVDSVLMAFHAEAAKDCAEDRIIAAIDALYGKTDDELTAASLGAKVRWEHFYTKTFFSYASAEALYDDIQNLDLRAILGIGAGDYLWKESDDRSWSVEAGISALYEDYSTRDDPELSPAARFATVYKEIVLTDVKVGEQLEILLPLDDVASYLLRSRTTIGVPLCQDLALRLSLEITYDADPPSGTEALDVLGLVGVEYQF
jgi:putative salt-induced outer membrane protein YdiY